MNASIEAVVRSGVFVPMSKYARTLVLLLGFILVFNTYSGIISLEDSSDNYEHMPQSYNEIR